MTPRPARPVTRAIGEAKLTLVLGNIVNETVDAIVNAANSSLMGGGGVDGAIHRAGGPAILKECKGIRKHRGRLPPGNAVETTAGFLPAHHVIHTVGPVWHGGNQNEAETLRSCYTESLRLARELGARTIAFPSISTGVYGYPPEDASKVALAAVRNVLSSGGPLEEVRFVLFDPETFGAYERSFHAMMEEPHDL